MSQLRIDIHLTEGDIHRAIKNPKYSPIHYSISRIFRELIHDVDIQYTNVIIWDDSINDYKNYRICSEYLEDFKYFLDSWYEFQCGNLESFDEPEFVFCVEKLK